MVWFECRGLSRQPWFTGFDLEVDEGEIVILAGPSGVGKTLLLRTLADLDPADGGEVRLAGRERGSMPATEWRSSVLYVHQSGVRLPGTVRENVARIACIAGHDPTPVPGLDDDADAERLSGGEAQRLALHRALLVEPRVLLLDEGTSGLDAEAARTWEERLTEWVSAGSRAILWVAHDRSLSERLDARVVEPWR